MSAARRPWPPNDPNAIADAADAAEPTPEVSFVTKDLAPILPEGEGRAR